MTRLPSLQTESGHVHRVEESVELWLCGSLSERL